MNPSEKWNDLEKYVYGEHKASCMLEAGGYACTCGKQEAAADLARITAERGGLIKLIEHLKEMNDDALMNGSGAWSSGGETDQWVVAALKQSS